MAEDKSLKPKTFRVDEETVEKIRNIAETIGGSQQEAFTKLIETYELQSSKSVLPDQKTNIEQFEKYVTALTHLYMVSLETNQNVTETVRTEFNALLGSKDKTIQGLQEQLSAAKQSEEDSIKKTESFKQENAKLKELLDVKESDYKSQAANLQSMLKDKDNLNEALAESCAQEKQKNHLLQERAESLELEIKELSNIKEALSALRTEHEQLLKSKKSLEQELQAAKDSCEKIAANLKQHESFVLKQCQQQSQFELDKTVLNMERKYQEQIQALKEEKQSEIDKYQQKYFLLLEKRQEKKEE